MDDFKAIILQLMNIQNEYQQKAEERIQQQLQQQQFNKEREEKQQQQQRWEEKLLQQQKEQQIQRNQQELFLKVLNKTEPSENNTGFSSQHNLEFYGDIHLSSRKKIKHSTKDTKIFSWWIAKIEPTLRRFAYF